MILFNHVSKRHPGGFEALREISFEIGHGEMAFLTGHSGAGKSTVLRLIALLERASFGQIVLNGQNLSGIKRRGLPYLRRSIGMVFQNHKLLHDRTVFDNVALPLVITGAGRDDIARRVHAALDKVGLLSKERAYPVTLSGGEQQRVGIARAVVHRPPLLLADEPTGNLAPELSPEIMTLFQEFNQFGVSVLVATHDLELIRHLPHRILTLKDGRLVADSAAA
jgi:cell division transport system ATP-binding protein